MCLRAKRNSTIYLRTKNSRDINSGVHVIWFFFASPERNGVDTFFLIIFSLIANFFLEIVNLHW